MGCGPNPPAPVKVMAVAPSQTGAYETHQVELKTISQLSSLTGSVAKLTGGARVVIDSSDPLQNLNGGLANQTDDQRFEAIVKDKGLDVRGNFIERAGVLWPADFHTWNMVTTYYNFETSYAYFQGLAGKDLPELLNMRVYYWPEVHLSSSSALTDNALYLSIINSFVVVPQQTDQLVPLAMNLGVIGHETAHRVFNKRVLADEGLHPAILNWQLTPFNLLKSLDEGLADFHGYATTCTTDTGCRPSFLAVSITDDATVKLRDLSNNGACMTSSLRTAFQNFSPDQWVRDPAMYQVGNLIAVSLYSVGNNTGGPSGVASMAKLLLTAYDDPSSKTPGLSQLINQNVNTSGAFTPEAVANVIAAHIPDTEMRRQWCNQISARLQLSCVKFGPVDCPSMPDCPATSVRDANLCPSLPQ